MAIEWITHARKFIGVDENQDAALIKSWVRAMGPSWFLKTFHSAKVPWCGVFVAWCLRCANVGTLPSLYMRASEWKSWGQPLEHPIEGCIAVYERQDGGHVAFVVGKTEDGSVVCLGGNQSNKVKLAVFAKERSVQYRWPSDKPLGAGLPTLIVAGGPSTNEA